MHWFTDHTSDKITQQWSGLAKRFHMLRLINSLLTFHSHGCLLWLACFSYCSCSYSLAASLGSQSFAWDCSDTHVWTSARCWTLCSLGSFLTIWVPVNKQLFLLLLCMALIKCTVCNYASVNRCNCNYKLCDDDWQINLRKLWLINYNM